MQEKGERIEGLRTEGWKVNKEKHGWKGEGFYEELRGMAIAELSRCHDEILNKAN